ncbi:hypothetical protein SC09_Contig26orf00002 [Bacillus subtilis]|uniref:Uncharacterized protein n=1 Tax=Bacillus subtilis TaxID=1423 RepID=A0A0D1KMZ9_BACIU|nr:hypothetical protein SC09_Contig26orf00002 [Bacillus subtilis]
MQFTVKKVIAAVANEQLPFIDVQIESENTSDEVVSFRPSLAQLATSTGVQIDEPSLLESDELIDEYVGKVNDSGSIIYVFDNEEDIKDLDSIRLRISAPFSEDIKALGDKLDLKINLEH